CATLEIHAKEGFMDRRYIINQDPNIVGKATRRWYSFQGPDRLTLRVDAAELTKPVVETLFIVTEGARFYSTGTPGNRTARPSASQWADLKVRLYVSELDEVRLWVNS